jgi:hypothetical protein
MQIHPDRHRRGKPVTPGDDTEKMVKQEEEKIGDLTPPCLFSVRSV